MAKIYILDDSEDVHNLVVKFLRKDHEVRATVSWQEALSYLQQNDVDLVLIDIKMPGISGEEMVQILQNDIPDISSKIVLFSALDHDELRKKARNLKVAGCIQKTFEKELLLRRIKRFLK